MSYQRQQIIEVLKKPEIAIVKHPDPILRIISEPVEEDNLGVVQDLGVRMLEILPKYRGLGLSASQIGLPICMFVMNVTMPLIVINPEIIKKSNRVKTEEEGCLSLPGIFQKIIRPHQISFKAFGRGGSLLTCQYAGKTARVFQHEFDHLQGTLIIDY